jgi:hypothetical protein
LSKDGNKPNKNKGTILSSLIGFKVTCLDSSKRGDGHHGVFLVEDFNAYKFVVKCYGRKRSHWGEVLNAISNYLSGRSSSRPLGRFNTEKKVLQTWHEYGFDVFKQPKDLESITVNKPHLLFEYVKGQTLLSYFADPLISKEYKIDKLKQFIPEWGRRHYLAMESGNRLLIQEHPSFKHVYINDFGRFIYFDFETVYTTRHSLPSLIGREIAGYIRSLYKVIPPDEFNEFLRILINEYPHREYLLYPYHYFYRHPNLLVRFSHSLARRLPRNKRRHSKYLVAPLISDYLHQTHVDCQKTDGMSSTKSRL